MGRYSGQLWSDAKHQKPTTPTQRLTFWQNALLSTTAGQGTMVVRLCGWQGGDGTVQRPIMERSTTNADANIMPL